MSSAAGPAPFTHLLDECDVPDKARLADFRKPRAEWVGLLEKDPLHSVSYGATIWVRKCVNQDEKL